MRTTKTIFSLAVLLMCASLEVSSSETHIPDELKESIEKRITTGAHPGIIIGIVDGAESYYYGFGWTDLESNLAPDKDTIYEIGSIGKTFTATLLADMIVKGDLDLTDPVQKFLPDDVTMPDFKGKPVTLGHLATHRSSLPRMPSDFQPANPLNPFVDYGVADLYDFLNTYKLDHAPGTERLYSNVGFGLLGHVLSLTSGKTYEDLVKTRITEPLRMQSTAIALNTVQKQRFAPPYALHDGRLLAVEHWDVPTLAGAGALRSSAEDILRYLAANLGLVEQNPLDEAMSLAQLPREFDGVFMGLGWSISGSEQRRIYAHNGGTGGYRTFTGFVPSENFGVIVMTNSTVSVDDIGIYLLVGSYPLDY